MTFKIKTLLPLLGLAITSAWAGGTYLVSQNSEAVLDQQLTQTQRLFEQQVLPFKWEKTSYTSGFNAAEATTQLSFRNPSAPADDLVLLHLKHRIQHGPIYFPTAIKQAHTTNPANPATAQQPEQKPGPKPEQKLGLGFGASRWITTIDTEQLPDETKAIFKQGFGQQTPLLVVSDVAPNGNVAINAQMARFALDVSNANILIDNSQLHSTLIDGRMMGNTLFELGQIELDSVSSKIKLPASELNMHITSYLGSIALGSSDWQLDDAHIETNGADIRFSAGINSLLEVKDGMLNADALLSLNNLLSPLPVNEASMQLQYGGFNADGLASLSKITLDMQQVLGEDRYADGYNTVVNAATTDSALADNLALQRAQKKASEKLAAQYPELKKQLDQAIDKTFVPGKSHVRLKLITQTGEQSSSADAKIQYAADAPSLSQFDFSTLAANQQPNPLLQLISAKLDLNLESSLFGQALFQALMPGLIQQGIFTEGSNAQGQSSFDLRASLDKGVLLLNGKQTPLPVLPGA